MAAPLWVLFIGLIVALPIYALWAVGAYMVYRAVMNWIVAPDPGRMPMSRQQAPRATLKG